MALSEHSRTLCKDKTNAMKQQLHAGITDPCCPLVVVVTRSNGVSLAGELGLRLRELQRRHAGHAPDEGQTATPSGHMTLTACDSLTPPPLSLSRPDDRMSVMSCRSAASCSAATAVLERAQRRRQSFWGNG